MVGYRRPSGQALFTAATGSRKRYQTHPKLDTAYPPPLILPGDDLAEDPKYPPQVWCAVIYQAFIIDP